MTRGDVVALLEQLSEELYEDVRENRATPGLTEKYADHILAVVNELMAEELAGHATFYWESAVMLEPLKAVALENADELMGPVLTAQEAAMRQVSRRLNTRAAEVRGISPQELAARGVLLLPSDAGEPPTEEAGP